MASGVIQIQHGPSTNTSNLVNSSFEKKPAKFWVSADASLVTVVVLDMFVSLICALVVASCVVWFIKRRARFREERDKLGKLIQSYLWEYEESILLLEKIIKKMEKTVIHREVTESHLLGYRYRCEQGVFDRASGDAVPPLQLKLLLPYAARVNIIAIIKKLEKLFESLAVQLPCKGRCQESIAQTFGQTIYALAQNTALLWSNQQVKVIKSLIKYFSGKEKADKFAGSVITDEELEMLVLARAPYVHQLSLHGEHFVLREVDVSSDLKVDLRNKIRYIDTVLAKNERMVKTKVQNICESYKTAREICINNNFVQNKNHFPEVVDKDGETSSTTDYSMYLLHLLRVICMPKHLRKVESDDKFFQFLMQLHESLYSWTDSKTMLEVIERSRNNIYSYLRGLSIEQVLMDKEFTKAKLEQIEKELYRHLSHLTLRQVQVEKQSRNNLDDTTDRKLRSINSESSIYTLAQSTCSYPIRKQHSLERPSRSIDLDLMLLHQQRSLDQGSLLSSSSMYATAASLTSINEYLPLMGTSPPSKPDSFLDRQQSPLSDMSDFFETAV